MLIFATRTAVAVVETASSEISSVSFHWSSQTLSFYLCGLGVLGTGILMALPAISKSIGEGILLCVGVFSLALGMALMMPYGNVEVFFPHQRDDARTKQFLCISFPNIRLLSVLV